MSAPPAFLQLHMHVGQVCVVLQTCIIYLDDLSTGVAPGEGTGATMSDDDDDQADSDTNFLDGGFDGPDSMGFGPLVPTESERSLMERVRQELKHELKQVNKLLDVLILFKT